MITSDAYNYINVLNKAADASWMRNTILSSNLANVDTPNYKRKDIRFESCLMAQMIGGANLDSKIDNLSLDSLNASIYTDHSSLSYRLDGNNVDVDTETAYLAENQLRHYALIDSITQEFSRIKTVLNNN